MKKHIFFFEHLAYIGRSKSGQAQILWAILYTSNR